MYNLLEGKSFFFESFSSLVIKHVLSFQRNEEINIPHISNETQIAQESVIDFMENLVTVGLISNKVYSNEDTRKLRLKHAESLKTSTPQNIQDLSFSESMSAEDAYENSLNKDKYIPTVMFEVTYRCSEHCIHCYNAGASRNEMEISLRGERTELSIDDYKRVIDELYDLGTYKICLSGGDPFSKPRIWDIIDYIFNKNIAIDIYTNGQSIINQTERLANYYPRLVGISVYSTISEIHDGITKVKGSLERTLSVIERLSNWGIHMVIKCVIMKPNVKSYHTVKDLAKKYGAMPQFEVNLCNGVDGDISIVKNLRLSKEVLEIVLRDKFLGKMYIGMDATDNCILPKPLRANPCKAGVYGFCLSPEGELTPCCSFPYSFGSVTKKTIFEILHGRRLEQWRNIVIEDMEDCGRHEKCNFCYLCPGNNFIEHGTPLKPSKVSCYMAEARYELYQKLKGGDDPLNGLSVEERLKNIPIEKVEVFKREMTNNYRNKNIGFGKEAEDK